MKAIFIILFRFAMNTEIPAATEEMVAFFYKRTAQHIAMVVENLDYVLEFGKVNDINKDELIGRSKVHDQSKYGKEEFLPYVWLTWLHKMKIPIKEAEEGLRAHISEAIQHHITTNRHHVEFENRKASEMTREDIVEMVCDWKAISTEMGTSLLEWAESYVKRHEFLEAQRELIFQVVQVLIVKN